MTLPFTNLGFDLINREIGNSDTASLSLDNFCVRQLAGQTGSGNPIDMANLRGKSINPLGGIAPSYTFTSQSSTQSVTATLTIGTNGVITLSAGPAIGSTLSTGYILCSQAPSNFQARITISGISGNAGSETNNSTSFTTISSNRVATFTVDTLPAGEPAARNYTVTVEIRRVSNNAVINSRSFSLTLATPFDPF